VPTTKEEPVTPTEAGARTSAEGVAAAPAAGPAAATVRPLGPDSLLWRVGFSRTSLLLAGRALLLQVAHPTIGAGVRDFSEFRTDPWGRLDRTVTSLLLQLFGGEGAAAEARRLREMHRSITGTGFDGSRYRALEPEAWAWVHIVNAETTLLFHDRMGRDLELSERERFWSEWRQVGLLLGIAPRHLPADLDALGALVDRTVATTLGDNETVRTLLETLTLHDVPPPSPAFPGPVWDALRPLGRSLLLDATVGTLPPALRDRLGLAWTDGQQRRLQRTATLVRTGAAALPDRVLHYPAAYRAVRAARRAGHSGVRR
jgi:uncharacterized protein (DUF2236 family)